MYFFFFNFMNANLPNPTQGQEYQDKQDKSF